MSDRAEQGAEAISRVAERAADLLGEAIEALGLTGKERDDAVRALRILEGGARGRGDWKAAAAVDPPESVADGRPHIQDAEKPAPAVDRLCWFCRYFSLDLGYEGSPGYSSWTPGGPGGYGSMECAEDVWVINTSSSQGAMNAALVRAKTCDLFEPSIEAKRLFGVPEEE